MNRPYRDPDWLREKYHDDERTQREIAVECGVSPKTIRDWMKRHDVQTREVAGENHGLYGTERDEAVKEKISETMEGREFSEETRRKISEANSGQSFPADARERVSEALSGRTLSRETRRKMSASTSGKQNPNWQGGYSDTYGSGWTIARERVRERDEVCQHCGEDGTNHELDVHHIVPVREFREDPEASVAGAHELDNLVLLCKRCHTLVEHGSITVAEDGTP